MDKRAKERVLIAKDALKWVRAGALVPANMVYVTPVDQEKLKNLRQDSDIQDRQARDVVVGQCQVCALGAIFLAKAVRYNNVTVNDLAFLNIPDWKNRILTEHFDKGQLTLIEDAFENWSSGQTARFARKYTTPKERMIAILKNIIANNGTFIP